MSKATARLDQPFAAYHSAKNVAEDAELTHVGPGTPGGQYLRRFWQPVALSSELGDLPKNIDMLGEALVLFRTRKGDAGLLDRHCSHRGASLEYGLPSDEGIVCCYHGWHYGTDGRVIEAPNDPASKAPDTLWHGAYPVHEFMGIIFAYMGPPDDIPDFPMLDSYDQPDTEMVSFSLYFACNWLQILDNCQDPTHSCFLHTRVSGVQFAPSWGELPELDYVATPIGSININVRRWKDLVWVRTGEIILPNGNQTGALWLTAEEEETFIRTSLTRWIRPIDDTHTQVIGWRYFNDRVDPHQDGDRREVGIGKIDFIGQTEDERPYDERQQVPGDYEAIVSQRPIAIHAFENLNHGDRGVALLRRLVRQGIRAVKAGKPFTSLPRSGGHVIPTYTQDTILTIPAGAGDDRVLMREMGRAVADLVFESARQPLDGRAAWYLEKVRELRP